MSFTFIPSTIMVIVVFIGFIFAICYYCYTIHSLVKNYNELKHYSLVSKIVTFGSLIYGTTLIVVFMIHAAMSGLYHDANATGPSDAETYFRVLTLVMFLSVTIILNLKTNQKNS